MKCFFFEGVEASLPWADVLDGWLDIVVCALIVISVSCCVCVGKDSNLETGCVEDGAVLCDVVGGT
jgi:hypothetical protein